MVTGKEDRVGRKQPIKSFRAVLSTTGTLLPKPMGLLEVPVSVIVGSVGRAGELTQDFLPRRRTRDKNRLDRFHRVEMAMREQKDLPPVELYRIGQDYFVLDGHHRVAAARMLGQLFLDAIVTDYLPDPRHGEEWALSERHAFETRTRLLDVVLTDPAHYRKLLNQIEEHRWALSQQRCAALDLRDAAADWCVTVFEPVLDLVHRSRLPEGLPDRTPADLYAYVSDHKWYESQRQGRDVGFAWAVTDFARFYPIRRSLLTRQLEYVFSWCRRATSSWITAAVHPHAQILDERYDDRQWWWLSHGTPT